jgi:hypothetical protein
MKSETKTCQNCKKEFTIEPEDFDFYAKIKVPPPTWCSECRMQRRFMWRNERALYKGKCSATDKKVITMFDPKTPFVVYEHEYWWSDKWDQLASGRDYDFSKPFFVQFRKLLESQPLPNLANSNVVNSEYGNHNADMKNCYLVYASYKNENALYGSGLVNCRDSVDVYLAQGIEKSYEISCSAGLYNVIFAHDSDNSFDSKFIHLCVNTNNSYGCVNLRSKSNFIFNKPHTKEEYKKEMQKIDFGSYKILSDIRNRFKIFSLKYPRRYASIIKCTNVSGDMARNSKNCHHCFDVYGNVEDSKFAIHAVDLKDSYDGYGFGGVAELMYEGVDSGINASRNKFTVFTHGCQDVAYTYTCRFSFNLFGCVGLKSKQYCILNKQYTKEEYERLVPKIIQHMNEMPYIDKKGRVYKYGEFFPSELSPFAYNETIAQEYFPLSKAEAKSKGYSWKDPEERDIKPDIKTEDIPDHIKDVKDDIVGKVIECQHQGKCNEQCTEAFRIIPQELEFYKRMNLPLPRLCPNCRHYQRLKQRNPLKLWHRKCQCAGTQSDNGIYKNTIEHFHGKEPCPNEFETTYSPERPEIVYCEECYLKEVV